VASLGIAGLAGVNHAIMTLTVGAVVITTLEMGGRAGFFARAAGQILIAQGVIEYGFHMYNLGNRVINVTFGVINTVEMGIALAPLAASLFVAAALSGGAIAGVLLTASDDLAKAGSKSLRVKNPIGWRSIDAATEVDPRLITETIRFRSRGGILNRAGMRRNVAVARLRVDGQVKYVRRVNKPGQLHAEERIAVHVRRLRNEGRRVDVEQLFTERVPCSRSGGCRALIAAEMPGAAVFRYVPTGRGSIKALREVYGL
jgi:hypothetical protein